MKIAEFSGAQVALEWREEDGEQVIVITAPFGIVGMPAFAVVRGLVELISAGAYRMNTIDGGAARFEIAHTPEVDKRLFDLSDLIGDIRWGHPTYTQIEMVIPAEEPEVVVA